ncbi:hypothetical protein I6F15_15900 [Bradyrhizobium sp. BRP14]|nr:hypothetical protein [Bradyrhizobium sp. BRP14]
MKHPELQAIAHNFADSLASGQGFLVGYYPSDIFAEAAQCHMRGVGTVNSHWQGPSETALYMYGSNFQMMRDRLTSFLQTYPLCQHCRIDQIA